MPPLIKNPLQEEVEKMKKEAKEYKGEIEEYRIRLWDMSHALEKERSMVMYYRCKNYFQQGENWDNLFRISSTTPNWYEYTEHDIFHQIVEFIKQIWGDDACCDLEKVNEYTIIEIGQCDFGKFYKADDDCYCDGCEAQDPNTTEDEEEEED